MKQKTPNFVSGGAPHVTTPVLPFPQLLLDVSRGTTAVCSAVQPYLRESEGESSSLLGDCFLEASKWVSKLGYRRALEVLE